MRISGSWVLFGASVTSLGLLAGCGASGSSVPVGTITTVAGTGTPGYAGDGGQATAAQLGQPTCAVPDSSGNLYIADVQFNTIRKVAAGTGVITTFAGSTTPGYRGDGSAAVNALLYNPSSCTFDAAGNFYFADAGNNVVREVALPAGVITTVVGSQALGGGFSGDGGLATKASLNHPDGLAIDAAGDIYVADYGNQRVRRVDAATKVITTIAGNGTYGSTGDNGPALNAEVGEPTQMVLDSTGANLYICQWGGAVVRKLQLSSGVITTVAGTGAASEGTARDGGPAMQATLGNPDGIAIDMSGNLYISDSGDNAVRFVNVSTGVIQTLAGGSTGILSGDGGVSTKASLHNPEGLSFDAAGDLFIADAYNSAVRKITFAATGVK